MSGVGRIDPAVVVGTPNPPDRRPRVELVGQLLGFPLDATIAEVPGAIGECSVHLRAVLAAEHRGLPHEDRCPPLAEPAFGQGAQGVGHLPDESPSKTKVPRSLVGGVSAREGDLADDAQALFPRGHASGCLLSSLRVVEGDGEPCLSGCCRALQ